MAAKYLQAPLRMTTEYLQAGLTHVALSDYTKRDQHVCVSSQ
jgi:hypothetical protein